MRLSAAEPRTVIDVEREVVIFRDGRIMHRTPWTDIGESTLSRLPSLVDEIGLGVLVGERTLWLRETDPGFWELFRALGIEHGLPSDWYARTEQGERFRVHPAARAAPDDPGRDA